MDLLDSLTRRHREAKCYPGNGTLRQFYHLFDDAVVSSYGSIYSRVHVHTCRLVDHWVHDVEALCKVKVSSAAKRGTLFWN